MDIVERDRLVLFLNEIFSNHLGIEGGSNGLQVEGKEKIKKMGFAVDYSIDLLNLAIKKNVDFLFVHHGIFKKPINSINGYFYNLIRDLIKNDINLYGMHLPLDLHPVHSHGVKIAEKLGLKNIEFYGNLEGVKFIVYGEFKEKKNIDDLKDFIKGNISETLYTHLFGKKEIKKVAIISGSGISYVKNVLERDVDLFITGETSHSYYHLLKFYRLNVFYLGHYNSEKWGILSIKDEIEKNFDIETEFFDIPTGL